MPQPDVFFEIAFLGDKKKCGQLRLPVSAKRKADAGGRLWGCAPIRSSVGNKAELAALLGPFLGEGLGQLGQRESVGLLAVDQGFDDVRGQGRQLEDAGHIRAVDVEGTAP